MSKRAKKKPTPSLKARMEEAGVILSMFDDASWVYAADMSLIDSDGFATRTHPPSVIEELRDCDVDGEIRWDNYGALFIFY